MTARRTFAPPLTAALLALGVATLTPTAAVAQCGDGVALPPEECDDGNVASGDGCSAACLLEDASALCAGVPASGGTALATVRVAAGLTQPVQVTAPPLDPRRLFVVEKPGTVRVIRDGALQPTPFLDLTGRVSTGAQQGLLSLAFHPLYSANRRVFVSYTDTSGRSVIARYETSAADPERVDAASERVLLVIPQPFAINNAGQLAFGLDGRLYAAMGDGGGIGDPLESAQNPNSLLGKILRLDADVEVPPYYAVPPDNPNPGAGEPLGLIWASGLRNPWRFSVDRVGGALWVGDVGQDQREEITYLPLGSGGANLGWDIYEGRRCYDPLPDYPFCPSPPPVTLTFPIHEYTHGVGCSVTGGFVYRGCALPALHGTYFYGDVCTAFVRTFQQAGGVAVNHADRTAELAPGGGLTIDTIVSFGEDARGELYIVDHGGEIFRIGPPPPPATATPTFTSTPLPTSTGTATATPSDTPTASATPTFTATPLPTDTPSPTATETATAVPTDTPEPTATATFIEVTPTGVVAPPTATATPTEEPPGQPCRGDVDGDGRVTVGDVVRVARALFSVPGSRRWNPAADLNGNGWVDPLDLAVVVLSLTNPACH